MQVLISRGKSKPPRTNLRIIAEIIDFARTKQKISHICRKVNIGGDIYPQFIDFMINTGILEKNEDPDGIYLKATEKAYQNYTIILELASFKLKYKDYPKNY